MSPPPPSWLARLADNVASQFYAADILAPLGCHYYHNKALDQYEVTLFASRTEIVGGKFDGVQTESRFNLDLKGLMNLFRDVITCHWQPQLLGPDDELGPHISIEGTYENRSVWLRVLAKPPERYSAGREAIAYEMRLKDIW